MKAIIALVLAVGSLNAYSQWLGGSVPSEAERGSALSMAAQMAISRMPPGSRCNVDSKSSLTSWPVECFDSAGRRNGNATVSARLSGSSPARYVPEIQSFSLLDKQRSTPGGCNPRTQVCDYSTRSAGRGDCNPRVQRCN